MPDRRLQPPPRVPAAGSGGPKVGPQTRIGRSNPKRRIGFIILCAALILGLIAVFVVLPRWQEGRQRRSVDIVSILTTEASPTPTTPPIENTVQPMMTVTPRATPHEVIEPTLEPLAPTPTRGQSEAERDFRGTMSEGLEALESGRWEEAQSALERADRLKPGAPEVADALARVAAGLREDGVDVRVGHRALEVCIDGKSRVVVCDFEGERIRLECDQVLVAVQRVGRVLRDSDRCGQ